MKHFQFEPFHARKNDVFYAFVVGAMFVVTVAGAVVGTADVARGHAGAHVAKAHGTTIAMRNPEREAIPVAPSGARQ